MAIHDGANRSVVDRHGVCGYCICTVELSAGSVKLFATIICEVQALLAIYVKNEQLMSVIAFLVLGGCGHFEPQLAFHLDTCTTPRLAELLRIQDVRSR